MPPIDPVAAIFVVIVAVLLPVAAVMSSVRLERGGEMPPARAIHVQAVVVLAALTGLAVWVARRTGIDLFPALRVNWVAWGVAAALMAGMLGFGWWRWSKRPEAERRRMAGLLPRNSGDWVLWVLVCIAAGVGEEIVYRGVLHTLFERWAAAGLGGGGGAGVGPGAGVGGSGPGAGGVGSTWGAASAAWWIAAVLSAAAFGAGHAVQGWTAAGISFVMALVLQGFVLWTGSLYLSMAEHFTYDLLAGLIFARLARGDGLFEGPGPARGVAVGAVEGRAEGGGL